MINGHRVAVIIPAFNEEPSIGRVVSAIPHWVDDIIVVDNGSTDDTAGVASESGARVVHEPRRGYGSACLTGMANLRGPDVVVFLDGDFSDYPEEMGLLVDPIIWGNADMVVGSRVLGEREAGSLSIQQIFGNWLACLLVRFFWGVKYTDLGPFRAIGYPALLRLNMSDPDFGWTVEMQIKAARAGLRVTELPVSYRKRIGKSKVSGTVKGVIAAGTKILYTIFAAALEPSPPPGGKSVPRERLIVFARYPQAGLTKTRLIAALGAENAAELHRRLTDLTVAKMRRGMRKRAADLEIRYEGAEEYQMVAWLGPGNRYRSQASGDLGARMARAFSEAFDDGVKRVVLVGTDIPGLTWQIAEKAFTLLRTNDLVLGPACDGGYYLIGLRKGVQALFTGIPWGTDRVLQETLAAAQAQGLVTSMVDPLQDLDRPEDLSSWAPMLRELLGPWEISCPLETPASEAWCRSPDPAGLVEQRVAHSTVSVIIPALNEAHHLGRTVDGLNADPSVDVIVVDGGSTDDTIEIAASRGTTVLSCPKGRAVQMNAGAARASGDILLFLHADTRLPDGWHANVRDTLASHGTSGGAFELRMDEVLPGSRLIERLTNARSKVLQMPYGDQALFMKAETFREVGGYPSLPIMEDFELVRRLRRRGRVRIVPRHVTTSARRWKRAGVLKTTLINQVVILAYRLGVSPSFVGRIHGMGDVKRRKE